MFVLTWHSRLWRQVTSFCRSLVWMTSWLQTAWASFFGSSEKTSYMGDNRDTDQALVSKLSCMAGKTLAEIGSIKASGVVQVTWKERTQDTAGIQPSLCKNYEKGNNFRICLVLHSTNYTYFTPEMLLLNHNNRCFTVFLLMNRPQASVAWTGGQCINTWQVNPKRVPLHRRHVPERLGGENGWWRPESSPSGSSTAASHLSGSYAAPHSCKIHTIFEHLQFSFMVTMRS